jgi:DNA-binding NarL/FixJ family response regulator
MKIRILLVDDHVYLRQGVRALLSSDAEFEIAGEAASGIEAIEMTSALNPDIVVLDLAMENINGLEATHQIRKISPSTRVVILSTYSREAYVLEAIKNGASGYVLKGGDPGELAVAIRLALKGERYLSPPISVAEIEAYLHSSVEQELDSFETLTRRERQVFQLAAEGKSNPEIAKQLFLSVRTVEEYRAKLMRKLKLQNQTDLTRYALQRQGGMIDEEL